MEEKKNIPVPQTETPAKEKEEFQLSETWAQDGLQELDDFIESQGIYIRQ